MNRLTIREACAELHCSRWTLDRLFRAGKLTKITAKNRSVYVDAAELRAYIRRNGTVGNPSSGGQELTAEDIALVKAFAEFAKQQFADATKQVA